MGEAASASAEARMVRSTEAVAADAARAVGPGRVVYLSPILIEAFFARPAALCAPQCVERSDQIEGTEATCAHGGGLRLK